MNCAVHLHDHSNGHAHETHDHEDQNLHGYGECGSHDHDHSHAATPFGHSHFAHADTAHKLGIALVLTFITLGAEVYGGIRSGSLALLSDAAHMLTDVVALGLAWYAQAQSARPPTHYRTYGFHRAGIMAAMANSVMLVVISIAVAWEAIVRIRTPHAVGAPIMIGVAAVALAVNLGIAYLLGRGQNTNLNVRSALLHVMGDAAAAFAVIVGGAIILWQPGATLIDPILSLGIAVVIVFGAWKILLETFNVLMEGAPTGLDTREVEASVAAVDGVRQVHHMHVWTLSPGMNALSGHVVIEDQALSQCEGILSRILSMLRREYQVDHATIQFEHRQCGAICTLTQDAACVSDAQPHV